MRHNWSLFTIVAVTVFIAFTVALAISQNYWGYALRQPSVVTAASEVAQLHRFQAFWPEGAIGEQSPRGVEGFRTAALYGADEDPSFPLGRLPVSLAAQGLSPQSEAGIDVSHFQTAVRVLRTRGLIDRGSAGYTQRAADIRYGYMLLGRTRGGREVLLVATHGGEVSNDHYAYYEAAFEWLPTGRLSLLECKRFYYDVAGIEGCSAIHIACALFVLLFPPAVLGWYALLRRTRVIEK